MCAVDFSDSTFTAPDKRRGFYTEIIPRYVDPDSPLRVLDVGCGTGEPLFDLAKPLSNATFTGVDISEPNIQIAEGARKELPFGHRLNFIAADYMNLEAGPFDVIVSDSTLHLISAPTERLFSKLANDLAPGGILVFTMPYTCFYNTVLITIRRIFSLFRSSLTDRFILSMGKLLHKSQMSEQLLRERIHYMYLLPERYLSPAFHQLLAKTYGLDLIGEHQVAHVSLAQPKHRVSVFRKRFER